jgi:cysteine-rich repeat protein
VDTFTGTCSKCGNGVVDEDELCDDGNSNSGNGCSNLCVPETGWTCLNPGGPC